MSDAIDQLRRLSGCITRRHDGRAGKYLRVEEVPTYVPTAVPPRVADSEIGRVVRRARVETDLWTADPDTVRHTLALVPEVLVEVERLRAEVGRLTAALACRVVYDA